MKMQQILKAELHTKTEKELEEVAEFEVKNLKRKLERMSLDERELAKKDPICIFEGIAEAAMKMFDPRLRSKVIAFMQLVLEKNVLRHLFLLALYQGAYGVRNMVSEQMQQPIMQQEFGVPVHMISMPVPRGNLIA